jgi:hypothetical protein
MMASFLSSTWRRLTSMALPTWLTTTAKVYVVANWTALLNSDRTTTRRFYAWHDFAAFLDTLRPYHHLHEAAPSPLTILANQFAYNLWEDVPYMVSARGRPRPVAASDTAAAAACPSPAVEGAVWRPLWCARFLADHAAATERDLQHRRWHTYESMEAFLKGPAGHVCPTQNTLREQLAAHVDLKQRRPVELKLVYRQGISLLDRRSWFFLLDKMAGR